LTATASLASMADDLFDALAKAADGMGVAGAPVRAFQAWLRRDSTKNLLRDLERELDAQWRDHPSRSDLFEQIARHMSDPRLHVPVEHVTEGDAEALEAVRSYLAANLGTETPVASEEVATVITSILERHVGRAQTSAQAAVDAVGRLRHEQSTRRIDEASARVAQQVDDLGTRIEAGHREIFEAIRDRQNDEPQRAGIAHALVLGPLRRVGAVDVVQNAERAAAQGRPGEAADSLLDVVVQLDDAGLSVAAENVRIRAATLLADAERHSDAAGVLTEVIRGQVARDSELAAGNVTKLREVLTPEERWRADGLEAIATWPNHIAQSIETLRTSAERATEDQDKLPLIATAVDLLSLVGRHADALDAAAPFTASPLADGERVAIELDVLNAREALGDVDDVETAWLALLRFVDAHASVEARGVAWQRRGLALAERGDLPQADDAYRRAMTAWTDVEGFEEQAADAFYSMQSAYTHNARWPPDSDLRALAYSLRGDPWTPASRINRLLFEGMQARLEPRGGARALRRFWLAFALARRTGSLTEYLIAADRLGELYEYANEPASALLFRLATGKTKESAALARSIGAVAAADALSAGGSRAYRAAVYAVIADVGRSLPDETVTELAPAVLREAAGDADSWLGPQPSIAAKRALAAIVLALPEHMAAAAYAQLVRDLSHGSVDVTRAAAHSLILATNVEAFDATNEVIALFVRDPYNHRISIDWITERLAADPDLVPTIRKAALAGSEPALQALVRADLADGDSEVTRACEDAVRRWAEFEPTDEVVVDGIRQARTGIGAPAAGAGILGRCVSASTRSALLGRMLDIACGSRDPEGTRADAARAIELLAPALTVDEATTAVDRLTSVALGEYDLSHWDANLDHPLGSVFIRIHQPGNLREAGVNAVAELTEAHSDVDRTAIARVVHSALRDTGEQLAVVAFEALAAVPELDPPVSLTAGIRHASGQVRLAALRAYVARHGELPPDEILLPLLADPYAMLRHRLIAVASDVRDPLRALEPLAQDPDAYIRLSARRALDDLRKD
jgi:hypothetical protein